MDKIKLVTTILITNMIRHIDYFHLSVRLRVINRCSVRHRERFFWKWCFMKFEVRNFWSVGLVVLSIGVTSLALVSCGKNSDSSSSADNSASGAAASAAGGALSGSSSSGTLAFLETKQSPTLMASIKQNIGFLPNAFADALCPTFKSTSGCDASGDSMWLSYDNCSFGGARTWNGVQELISTATASCGTFPNPGANGNLIRQIVASSGSPTPGMATITAGDGSSLGTIDDATANLGNFDLQTIATVVNGGYGAKISFGSNGMRDALSLNRHVVVDGVFNHSVTGNLAVAESVNSPTTRTLSGSVTVYHNLLKVVGTSTFNDVIHEDSCCFPVGGNISTVFAAGSNVAPTSAGLAVVGKSESLTFTGCGTAVYQSFDGSTANVTLNRCF